MRCRSKFFAFVTKVQRAVLMPDEEPDHTDQPRLRKAGVTRSYPFSQIQDGGIG
jgi:hypothetical protein